MPQRFLRPGLTTSERFNAVSWHAQSFYVRLLTLVDDFGRYDANPRLLISHAFPFGDHDGKAITLTTLDNICKQLSTNALADFYIAADGKKYLQVVRWQERARAEKSKYPAFDNTCEHMFTNDNKCSLPSPSPSPLHPRHSSNGSGEPTSRQTDAEWLKELNADKTYNGIDVEREHGKMSRWCKEKRVQPTRRRFINWLNRIDRPITTSAKNSTVKLPDNRPDDAIAFLMEEGRKNRALRGEE